eukprot:523603_1
MSSFLLCGCSKTSFKTKWDVVSDSKYDDDISTNSKCYHRKNTTQNKNCIHFVKDIIDALCIATKYSSYALCPKNDEYMQLNGFDFDVFTNPNYLNDKHTLCVECRMLFLSESDKLKQFAVFVGGSCSDEFSIASKKYQKRLTFIQKWLRNNHLQNVTVLLYELLRYPLILKYFMETEELFHRLSGLLMFLLRFWVVEKRLINDATIDWHINISKHNSHNGRCHKHKAFHFVSQFSEQMIECLLYILNNFSMKCKGNHIEWFVKYGYFDDILRDWDKYNTQYIDNHNCLIWKHKLKPEVFKYVLLR